ncbi:uncharacterized protein LOC110860505 [Folsomia candida]|nr:uncharacterized protein LOC110860505 [Folsomia candida]
MLAKCPITICGAKIPMRFGPDESEFDMNGWGRCRNCKSFIFRDHIYCQSCRCVNQAAKENQDLIVKQALAKRLHAQKKENEEKDSKIARLEADYLELSLILSKKNAERNSKGADNFKQSGIVDTHGDFVEKTATEESSEVDGDKPNNEDNEDKQD